MNQNRSKTQKCSIFSTKSVVKFLTRNVVIFQPEVYQQFVDTLLVEKLLHFWVLLRFRFKSYYVSGFYYNSGSKVTMFLVSLHFWLFTTFLGLTDLSNFEKCMNVKAVLDRLKRELWDNTFSRITSLVSGLEQRVEKSLSFDTYKITCESRYWIRWIYI